MGWCGNRISSATPHHSAGSGDVDVDNAAQALRIARVVAAFVDRSAMWLYAYTLSHRITTRAIVATIVIVGVGVGLRHPANGDTLLNTLNDGLRNDTGQFFPGSFLVMNSIFGAIATLVVMITLAEYLTVYRSVAGIGRVFLRIILMILVPWGVLQVAQQALPTWYNLALSLGNTITGLPIAPNPDGVFSMGATLARQMLTVVGQKLYADALSSGLNFAQAGVDLLLLAVAVLAALILFVSFSLLAVELLVAFAQGYIGMAVGAYQLGFSAAQATSGYATAYWGLVLSVFTRIFVTQAIIGIGLIEATKWVAQINKMGVVTDVNGFATSLITMLQIPLLGVAFFYLTTKVTDHAMAQLTGRPAYSGAGGVHNVAQGAMGGSVQGAIAGAMAGGPVGAVSGAMGGGMRGAMSGSSASRGARAAR